MCVSGWGPQAGQPFRNGRNPPGQQRRMNVWFQKAKVDCGVGVRSGLEPQQGTELGQVPGEGCNYSEESREQRAKKLFKSFHDGVMGVVTGAVMVYTGRKESERHFGRTGSSWRRVGLEAEKPATNNGSFLVRHGKEHSVSGESGEFGREG